MPKPKLLPDELAYLQAAGRIALRRAEVGAEEPFSLLGWPWDRERCLRIADALDKAGCIEKSTFSSAGWSFRITSVGFRVAGI
jgi:hypothetical protein